MAPIRRGLATGLMALLGTASCWAAGDVQNAGNWSGHIGAEARVFLAKPLYPEQDRHNGQSGSIVFEPSYRSSGAQPDFIFTPFGRLDSTDPERTHFDIRELSWLWAGSSWQAQAGIGKVFWGQTESQHLVDIVNQTDLVEYPDGEEKLGQPMFRVGATGEWGAANLFVLPYHRKRTFPGPRGRLRSQPAVSTDRTEYESVDKERHVDVALRYARSTRDWEIGLTHFRGTAREPSFINLDGEGRWIPFYEQISQTGLDLLHVAGAWLWKLEAIRRTGQRDRNAVEKDFTALIGGFEYTFNGAGGSGMDIGLLTEWLYDSRKDTATTPYEDDLFLGARLGFNDTDNTSVLMGVIHDAGGGIDHFSIEASRRLNKHWTYELNSLFFFTQRPQDDYLYSYRRDDFIQLQFKFYF